MGKARPLAPILERQCGKSCFSENVVDIQKIKYCVDSPDCSLCGDKRLLIIDRLIDGEYSDETLNAIVAILISN